MNDFLFFDPSLKAAQIALDGLSFRRNLIGQNIANVDTPGYQSQDVEFESVLKRALKTADRIALVTTQEKHIQPGDYNSTNLYKVSNRSGGTDRADGNNVDIDLELVQLTETGVRYQALNKIVSKKLGILKSIATGG